MLINIKNNQKIIRIYNNKSYLNVRFKYSFFFIYVAIKYKYLIFYRLNKNKKGKKLIKKYIIYIITFLNLYFLISNIDYCNYIYNNNE